MLLRNGASVAALDEDLSTPLHFAAAEGHRRIAAALIRVGSSTGRPQLIWEDARGVWQRAQGAWGGEREKRKGHTGEDHHTGHGQ